MKFFFKLLIVLWVIVLCIGSYVLVSQHRSPGIHLPAFSAGDCFLRNGIREVWEPPADGKVIYKGQTKYLLMGSEEAERRHGGDKAGFPQDILSFDMNHHLVLCPPSWKGKS